MEMIYITDLSMNQRACIKSIVTESALSSGEILPGKGNRPESTRFRDGGGSMRMNRLETLMLLVTLTVLWGLALGSGPSSGASGGASHVAIGLAGVIMALIATATIQLGILRSRKVKQQVAVKHDRDRQ